MPALFALLLALPLALAGDADLMRDLNGEVVQATEEGTLVVFFSMSDPKAPEELANLARRQEAGEPVFAVSVDSVTDRARLRPYLAGHGLRALRIGHDPMAELCRRLGVDAGESVLVAHDQANRVRWRGPSPSEAPRAEPEDEGPAPIAHATWLEQWDRLPDASTAMGLTAGIDLK